jgi:hypothetical protein
VPPGAPDRASSAVSVRALLLREAWVTVPHRRLAPVAPPQSEMARAGYMVPERSDEVARRLATTLLCVARI